MGIGRHKVLHMASFAGLYACWFVTLWIRGRCAFATLSAPDAKWYLPWSPAKFSVPAPGVRVLVRDIDWVLPWYVEKLGLRKLAENPHGESGVATLRFKVDGNSVVLATRSSMAPPKTPMLFTKKISKIRNVLVARGVEVGSVERDRQGTRYFDIHDPEGNLIEFVEEA
jgi:catechol 2,3-dioxygenase-like lactoylglutathione lyase family enzyme